MVVMVGGGAGRNGDRGLGGRTRASGGSEGGGRDRGGGEGGWRDRCVGGAMGVVVGVGARFLGVASSGSLLA